MGKPPESPSASLILGWTLGDEADGIYDTALYKDGTSGNKEKW